ncbi:hypothetical protein ACOSP7_027963 [Xanthoceras sorbifolium]|uniref:NAP1-related protein 2 n=1 Tax=Xanthoceras sorbifolium TaxID=99658 RepID=A0ABQ8HDM3_9ROSI|nr:hypothetical protein JRO89_XS12G0243400 [Xanthoceras sorbifolium]
MTADKGKKLKVAEKIEDQENPDHEIDNELILSVERLQEVQDDLQKINEEASDKVLEIERKYNEIRRPVYNKRSEIIKSIPDFWLTAFLSHPDLCNFLSEEDQKIFKYMHSLDVEDFKDMKTGYCITFNFNKNPYFENTMLTKTLTFLDVTTTKLTGTTIKWNEGMGAAAGNNHEKEGTKRPFTEESFFTWLGETTQKDIVEVQDEIAEIIKEDLWPNPLKYFINEADEEENLDDDHEEENASAKEQDRDGEDGK